MTHKNTQTGQQPIKVERSYQADVQDLWDLWTTKEGFESWWGPKGFRVEVHKLDLKVGGELFYDMIAVGAEEIAFMKSTGMPVSHETRGTFVEIVPLKRLKIRHMIDFIPGVRAYENNILVEFMPEGANVRMVVTIDPHHDAKWTAMAQAGFESQLTKLPAVLAQRAR